MIPDSSQHNPDPTYLRELIAKAGFTQRQASMLIGVNFRNMRQMLNPVVAPSYRVAPYPVQFALEALAYGPVRPNASQRRTDPQYIRDLVARAGIAPEAAALALGVSRIDAHELTPYTVQFAVEALVNGKI